MRPITAAAQGCTNAHGAVIATRPASMPFAIIPGSGWLFGVRSCVQNIATTAPNAAASAVFDRDHGEPVVGGRQRRRGVEAEPAEQQDERAEHRHRDVVRGEHTRLPVGSVLADAGPEDDRAGQAGHTAHHVHDAGTGEVDVAVTHARRLTELGEPAAAPRPRREQRVVDGAAEEAPTHERVPLPPLGHGAGRDGRRRVHEGDHVEEERGRRHVVRVALEEEPALPEEDPVPRADQVRRGAAGRGQPDRRCDVAPERERVARRRRTRRSRGRRSRSSSTRRGPRASTGRIPSRPARTRLA